MTKKNRLKATYKGPSKGFPVPFSTEKVKKRAYFSKSNGYRCFVLTFTQFEFFKQKIKEYFPRESWKLEAIDHDFRKCINFSGLRSWLPNEEIDNFMDFIQSFKLDLLAPIPKTKEHLVNPPLRPDIDFEEDEAFQDVLEHRGAFLQRNGEQFFPIKQVENSGDWGEFCFNVLDRKGETSRNVEGYEIHNDSPYFRLWNFNIKSAPLRLENQWDGVLSISDGYDKFGYVYPVCLSRWNGTAYIRISINKQKPTFPVFPN